MRLPSLTAIDRAILRQAGAVPGEPDDEAAALALLGELVGGDAEAWLAAGEVAE